MSRANTVYSLERSVPDIMSATASPAATAPPNMGPSPFFYYQPEATTDSRHHGHFSPQPKQDGVQAHQLQQQWYHQHLMYYGQPPMMYPHLPSSGAPMHQKPAPLMTTPRPVHHKPASLQQMEGKVLAVNTDCNGMDFNMFPSTPALSSSGSSTSSPPSTCGILPTPTTDSYMGLEGVKEGCHGDVSSEILAGGEFARCGSPVLTPGMILHFASSSVFRLKLQ